MEKQITPPVTTAAEQKIKKFNWRRATFWTGSFVAVSVYTVHYLGHHDTSVRQYFDKHTGAAKHPIERFLERTGLWETEAQEQIRLYKQTTANKRFYEAAKSRIKTLLAPKIDAAFGAQPSWKKFLSFAISYANNLEPLEPINPNYAYTYSEFSQPKNALPQLHIGFYYKNTQTGKDGLNELVYNINAKAGTARLQPAQSIFTNVPATMQAKLAEPTNCQWVQKIIQANPATDFSGDQKYAAIFLKMLKLEAKMSREDLNNFKIDISLKCASDGKIKCYLTSRGNPGDLLAQQAFINYQNYYGRLGPDNSINTSNWAPEFKRPFEKFIQKAQLQQFVTPKSFRFGL